MTYHSTHFDEFHAEKFDNIFKTKKQNVYVHIDFPGKNKNVLCTICDFL